MSMFIHAVEIYTGAWYLLLTMSDCITLDRMYTDVLRTTDCTQEMCTISALMSRMNIRVCDWLVTLHTG
ncbi:hypothetical protein J6590_070862 [Homalodisca vitripennis]|nr:hypothetical protein J6590_070862 [Homalodisca vitripennis]